MIANAHIKIGGNPYEKVKTFKYLGSLLTNQNSTQDEIKCRLKAGNSGYYSVQTFCPLDCSLRIWKLKYNNNIASCAIWLWNMVSYIKGGIQAEGIWKQDPEANIWAQEGWEWGVEKAPQWGIS